MRLSSRPIARDLADIGWRSRGYLPHFDAAATAQFITFRLKDSLPQKVLDTWRQEMLKSDDDALLRRRVESYLDQGYGSASLRDKRVASLVQQALLHHDEGRYRLAAWVVMPNHVHFLAAPCPGLTLARIMHALKSYTAHEANKILRREGTLWMEDYFDRYIRDARHFRNIIAYIENNPVKAKLCHRPEDWPFSSARFRERP